MAQNPFEQQAPIPGIRHIIAVGSGKGGVGKSTVAVNLALALGRDHKVGLLDADLYGPSIPRMLGALNQKPEMTEAGKIAPLVRHGLKLMSIGFLVDENQALIWRGPMLFKAMDQFFRDVNWGDLDYLVIDLPPGTGDVVLTMAQKVPVNGAITVCTPQNLAFADAKKALDLYDKVNVPQLGVVENMAYMLDPESGRKIQMFPKGEMDSYLDAKGIPKLGEVPFHSDVARSSEAGIPIVVSHPDSPEAQSFIAMAAKIQEELPPA
ncbi:MAG: Mrp/NBP35 family ATP-binding protein [Bdellovibrionaceae bacterium]|nr:Mrp/NBP35 family ATP-binding protein [Bdellovibrionales bacterium]MCB9084389.1 Mrp/NBP35 family ATP-binding protein [Pseudobdellovibrionaceae bacterium]